MLKRGIFIKEIVQGETGQLAVQYLSMLVLGLYAVVAQIYWQARMVLVFFASTDAGDSWTRITSIWTVETRATIASGQYVFAGTDMLGVFKSTNNGGSFFAVEYGAYKFMDPGIYYL